MKKVLCFLVAISLVVLCGCNSQSSTTDQETVQETVDPIEERKNLLSSAYESCCDSTKEYAVLSYDNTSLVIDTKPGDSYYRYESEATTAIAMCNNFLKLPSSVAEKMSSTRALDGMQSQNCGDFTVSWTYHPDNGLKVIYEVNFS